VHNIVYFQALRPYLCEKPPAFNCRGPVTFYLLLLGSTPCLFFAERSVDTPSSSSSPLFGQTRPSSIPLTRNSLTFLFHNFQCPRYAPRILESDFRPPRRIDPSHHPHSRTGQVRDLCGSRLRSDFAPQRQAFAPKSLPKLLGCFNQLPFQCPRPPCEATPPATSAPPHRSVPAMFSTNPSPFARVFFPQLYIFAIQFYSIAWILNGPHFLNSST